MHICTNHANPQIAIRLIHGKSIKTHHLAHQIPLPMSPLPTIIGQYIFSPPLHLHQPYPQQYLHNQTQQSNMTNALVTPLTLRNSRDTYQRMQFSTIESPSPPRRINTYMGTSLHLDHNVVSMPCHTQTWHLIIAISSLEKTTHYTTMNSSLQFIEFIF